ncbi:MAG: hypothetical protein H0U60_02495 [Blastocatellia bacterium]|nr:hypothetical protein [Blastocatellia bacterium]
MTEPITTNITTTTAPTGSTTTPTGAEGAKTFTQEDIDRIVGERAARAKDAGRGELFQKFGVKDETELEAKLKQLADMQTAQLTEQERLQKERDDAKAESAREKEQANTRIAQANTTFRRAAILTAAADKFTDPADVWLYVQSKKELADKLVIDENDVVQGVVDVLKQVETDKKHWLKANGATTSNGTPTGTGPRKPALPPDGDKARDAFAKTVRGW